jgi:AcrR family transcriptional regulator
MPKVIPDLQAKILAEAKRQAFENGYASMTVRSVAQKCGIAVGTIYNYYPSKDRLTAAFILKDWVPLEEELRSRCKTLGKHTEVFRAVYEGLLSFEAEYRPLFRETSAIQSASRGFHERHCELRKHLAEILKEVCAEQAKKPNAFLPEFIAEALLAWSGEGRAFKEIAPILENFFE